MSTLAPSRLTYIATTVIVAATAALAAAASLTLSLPLWAMFIGWIAYFTRIQTTRTAVENLATVGVGMIIGVAASLAVPQLAAMVGPLVALPVVVFVVALGVVALRGLPVMNNQLGYFLGLVAWFAGHLKPSLESLVQLFGAIAVGTVAGWVSHSLPPRILRQA